jgi:hypothetical protein
MTSAERQRRFIAKREAKAKAEAKAEARPVDPYGLGPIVQVERLRQLPTATASWLRDKLGDLDARALHAALGQAIEDTQGELKDQAKAGGATDDQARALDDALAKLEAEIERSGTKGPESKPPQPGEWCAAFSVAGLESVGSHLDALKARISELESELARERGKVGRRRR